MIELFRMVRNTALPATAVMAVVLLLRWILPNFSKRTRCSLWALVLIALTVPMVFHPTSPFSLMPASLSNGGFLDSLSNGPIEEVQFHYEGSETYDQVIAQGGGWGWTEGVGNYVTTGPDGISPPKTVQEVTQPYLAWGWFLVMCGMVGYALVSYGRLARRMGDAESRDGLVYYGQSVTTPFILGVVRPRIYLPAGMDEAQARMVLAHEKAHLQRGDHIWKVVGYALLSVYWFHPLCWVCYKLFCRDIELACDEKVVRNFAPEQRADYSQALLQCSAPERFALTCPLAFGEVGVKERVQNILNYKKPAFWVTIVAVVACIAAAVAFLTEPVYYPGPMTFSVEVPLGGGIARSDMGFGPASNSITVHDNNGIDATLRLVDERDNVIHTWETNGDATTRTVYLTPEQIQDREQSDTCYFLEVEAIGYLPEKLTYIIHDGKADCGSSCIAYSTKGEKAPLDLVGAMQSAKVEEFPALYGNATAQHLVDALHGAADKKITEEEAKVAGYEGQHWHADMGYCPGGDMQSDMRFSLACGTAENIVHVRLYDHPEKEECYFEDETLYWLVRRYMDIREEVDLEAYGLFEPMLTENMLHAMDAGNRSTPGVYSGYELLRFTPVLTYEENDGAQVVLYDYEFALLPIDIKSVGWMGGMRLDSELRVLNYVPKHYFAARFRDGAVVEQSFVAGDTISFENEEITRNTVSLVLNGMLAVPVEEIDAYTLALLDRMEQGETTLLEHHWTEGTYPLWMEPYSEIVCDEKLVCTTIKGRELTTWDIMTRRDVLMVGLQSNVALEPNTKATYDLHGYIQNIYYEIPGKPGEYQLSPPQFTVASETMPDTHLNAITKDSALSLRLEQNGTRSASYTQLWDLGNSSHYLSGLQNCTWRTAEAGTTAPGGDAVTLSEMNGWKLTAYADSSVVYFIGPTGEAWLYCEGNAPYELLRSWYDEVEFSALGGTYDKQGAIVIPDSGQDYLAAAKDFTQAFEGIHLQAGSGSKFRYSFVATRVSEAEDITQVWRENGTIDEDTYCFFLYTAFVAENQRALNDAMAGNTRGYEGTDPHVPEGAWEYTRCGIISRKADGWHGELLGTGW